MARGEYYVSKAADRWKVEHNGISVTFDTPKAALVAALREANQAGNLGLGGRVLVQRTDGRWQAGWTHGVNPAPVAT